MKPYCLTINEYIFNESKLERNMTYTDFKRDEALFKIRKIPTNHVTANENKIL